MKDEFGNWSSNVVRIIPKPLEQIPHEPDNRYYGPDKWRAKVHKALMAAFPAGKVPRDPVYKVAPNITAATLLKNTELAESWRQSARHAASVEMELGGIYIAARFGGDGNTRVLAIRGLSDIVGYKRAPEWTAFACVSAAVFAEALVMSGLLLETMAGS
jgi:nucleoside phosphorylase